MAKPKRQHPLAVVHAFGSYILLLALPLLRSLLLLREGWRGWLSGVWQDGLVLAAILVFGYLRWRMNTYEVLEEGIFFRDGIFFRRSRYIPYYSLTAVVLERPFYLRPFPIARILLETDAGSPKDPDVALLLRQADAKLLMAAAGRELPGERLTRAYTPNPWAAAFLSLLTSNSLTGVLFASTLISQTGRLLGKEAEERLLDSLTRLMQLLAFGLPPAAAAIALILLGGWLLSFALHLVNHLGFKAERRGGMLTVRAGVLTLRQYQLTVKKINFMQLRQSLLTRLLGYCAVLINCTGYGKGKNELAVLLPAANEQELRRGLQMVLPEIRPGRRTCRCLPRTVTRFLIPPLTLLAALFAAVFLAWRQLPALRTLVFFLGLMGVLPAVWWFFVKLAAFRYVGVELKGRTCTFRSVFGYAFYTTVAPADKVTQIELRRSLFQKMAGCCDMVVRLRSEKGRRIVVQNVPQTAADSFLTSWAADSAVS
ncbi:MAG: PH domain-containing protein [Oscillospiraceae bacterium]|nr:PH domain-containing protein [Oscillospiraceae bacterium]